MGSIFDKYKAKPVGDLKKIKEEEDKFSKRRAEKLELASGQNKIRIWPAHPGEQSWKIMYGQHWFDVTGDDGKPLRRATPDSMLAGLTEIDIMQAYINFVAENYEGEDASEVVESLTAYEGGIHAKLSWASYASHVKEGQCDAPQFFPYGKTISDGLYEGTVTEGEDEAITLDPYSDPINGVYALITLNDKKGTRAADRYKVKPSKNAAPITEEQLVAYDKMTPLSQLPDIKFSMQHFETQLEGLRYIDSKKEINLFDTDEFQAIVTATKKELVAKLKGGAATSASKEDKTSKKGAAKPPKKKGASLQKDKELGYSDELPFGEGGEEPDIEEGEELDEREDDAPEEGDKFDEMSRQQLISYKKQAGYTEFKLLTTDTDDEMRDKLRAHEATLNLEVEEEETEEDTEVEEEEAPPAKQNKKTSAVSQKEEKNAPRKGLSLDSIRKELKEKTAKK